MFEGYKRLADTDCNVSPRILAFVGQNEAGKSSVLAGLEWLTEDDETPLDSLDASRSNKKPGGWIVGASYAFNDEDLALLEPLGFATVPQGMSLFKQADGRLHVVFDDPRKPKRDPKPFVYAAEALSALEGRLSKQFDDSAEDFDEEEGPTEWWKTVTGLLEDPERSWDEEQSAAVNSLAEWLEEIPTGGKRPRGAKAAVLLRAAAEMGTLPHPKTAGIELMRERVPKFVLFKDEDRDLPTVTVINTPQAVAAARPAIRNVLAVSGLNATEVWQVYAAGDSGEVQTLLGQANETLDAFFGQAWNQSNISVRLDIDASGLHTHIYEIDSKRFTRIEERSDGLRAFVALAAFLESQRLTVPPILLIDEAETHLHFDAQADLVGVLLKQVRATQVFYTTHSPGCLPSDLGTGIRLLKRTGAISEISSHFWTNEAPGFAALLFAMGAGAAAFSACRWAVLAEGASEMVLLPTLLRLANGVDDLPYQVAPGLSNARAYDMDVEEVAAKVVYLADGDSDGDRYRRDLEAAEVPAKRIFQFPQDVALEDLLDTAFYLDVVNGLLPTSSAEVPLSLDTKGLTISLAVKKWAEQQKPKVQVPGKVAVAYAVLDKAEIRLSPNAPAILQGLHTQFLSAFSPAAASVAG